MTTSTPIANPELQLAADFVRDTGCHIFLTGKAGTGKTTFLKNLKTTCSKRMVVTAPTGVAAVNAGGVTLHSFFQLPFGPFVPGADNTRSQFRFSKEKKNIIKSLDLLVIDEISMVRADVLDGVDSVLRRHRRSNQPFGGVQLLMIGDLFQLPPVITENERHLFEARYPSPYFFSSNALQTTRLTTIELKRIYRQTDNRFIELLNRVRNNRLDNESLALFNQRHEPGFLPDEKEGYITLCTHNRMADSINRSRLSRLSQTQRLFVADIEGEFPENIYPTEAELELKKGAQVMLMRNDSSPERRYFNGKIGTITRFTDEEVFIKCPGDKSEIKVEPVTWENIEYTLDKETGEIKENRIGLFRQYPLKLAWAITIHKSQGLTFDKAIIDAQAAFAHGQVYVALSRCRSLEGMVLSSSLRANSIQTDAAIERFTYSYEEKPTTVSDLEKAKIYYQQQLLLDCFDFQKFKGLLRRTVSLLLGNAPVIEVFGVKDIREMQRCTEVEICTVCEKFVGQLHGLFSETQLPAADPRVLERIGKAAAYFEEKINGGIGSQLTAIRIETDNKNIRKEINDALKRLRSEAAVKLAGIRSCAEGFSPSAYFRALSAAEIDAMPPPKKKDIKITYDETDIGHPELFQILKDWRSRKAEEESIAHFQVLHQKTLIQITIHLPDSIKSLKKVWGIGDQLAARYGEELVEMVCAYREAHGITEVILPEPKPAAEKPKKNKAPKIDTKKLSLELFQSGLTISEIAAKRELVTATIEGHLTHWVEKGILSIDHFLSTEQRETIGPRVAQMEGQKLSEIKANLGDDVSYGEIRLMQAHLKYLSSTDIN